MQASSAVNAGATAFEDIHREAHDSEQYLTFLVGTEHYGVEILKVQEIKGWEGATHVPNTIEYVRGVMNLRGDIVPVVDLRVRLGIESQVDLDKSVVIVVRVEVDGRERGVGMLVDGVADVCDVRRGELQEGADLYGDIPPEFVRGLGSVDSRLLVVLEIDRLLEDALRTSLREHTPGARVAVSNTAATPDRNTTDRSSNREDAR
ncbi:MAG: purine-binding chemotaxis protein CheW [Ectothiorhodospiraceae bacterium]|nr:purine-binding chemotaxis protein CheW [Chromatiales bacterium]MCP5154761.1 purine-binding chemotaxis protein CheW [Ectothiorhodospiraceae bacterium]